MVTISKEYLTFELLQKYGDTKVKNLYFLSAEYLDNIPAGYNNFEKTLPNILDNLLIINDKIYLIFNCGENKYYMHYNFYDTFWSKKYLSNATIFIEFENDQTLWLIDSKKNNVIFTEELGVYNPDGPTYILCDDFTLDQFKLVISKTSNLYVGELLLNTKYLLGINNVLKCEILAYAKIAPTRLVNTLKDDRIEKLYESIIVISRLLFNSEVNLRKYSYLVYQVKGAKKEKFKDNFVTYWFPEKQF